MRSDRAGEVVIIYDPPAKGQRPSIWDYFGKSPRPRTAADIDEQIRQERQSWIAENL